VRVTILGGAAAGPGPRQGCSGYLVETAGTRLALDLGPGTLPELRQRCDPRDLDAIVISHMHIDHMLDLIAFWWGWLYTPAQLAAPLPLWLPPGGRSFLTGVAHALSGPEEVEGLFSRVFAVREYVQTASLTIGDTIVSFTPTLHDIPCHAIRVGGADGRSAGYTADNGDAARLVPFMTGVDLLIAEATLAASPADPAAERGTSTAAEVAALARDSGAATLVLTHIWAEDDHEARRQQAAAIFAGRIEIASPGLAIDT
jgi:ribonuclease BN (tRNA processing enzyme)